MIDSLAAAPTTIYISVTLFHCILCANWEHCKCECNFQCWRVISNASAKDKAFCQSIQIDCDQLQLPIIISSININCILSCIQKTKSLQFCPFFDFEINHPAAIEHSLISMNIRESSFKCLCENYWIVLVFRDLWRSIIMEARKCFKRKASAASPLPNVAFQKHLRNLIRFANSMIVIVWSKRVLHSN